MQNLLSFILSAIILLVAIRIELKIAGCLLRVLVALAAIALIFWCFAALLTI
jgi:hypothetical protein